VLTKIGFEGCNNFVTFPQQGSNLPLWVTTSTSLLKSHTGATQALTGARESWVVRQKSKFVHYYLFLSFGIKPILLVFRGIYKKSAPKSKNQLATSSVQS